MGTNNNTVVVSFSIAILLLLSLLLLLTYNSKCNVYLEPMDNMQDPKKKEPFYNGQSAADFANKYVDLKKITDAGNLSASNPNGNALFAQLQGSQTSSPSTLAGPSATQQSSQGSPGSDAVQTFSNIEGFYNAPYPDAMNVSTPSSMPSQDVQACFPRDRLTAQDLLPKDAADSKWARLNPSGTGDVHDQNYLTAGYHIGVNTVGQSMRNANLQLRSEIPNPQGAVGPWMISTIEPDMRQNVLEIGSSAAY